MNASSERSDDSPMRDSNLEGHGELAEHDSRRAFEMSADWVLTDTRTDPRCDPGDRWFEFSGTGDGTDVGHCVLYAAHCTRGAEPPECTTWYNGVWTITAQDGDVLNITFCGHWLEPGRAAKGVDVMTVVGGTGRFAGARGEMIGDLYPDWSEWPRLTLKQTIRGWISY